MSAQTRFREAIEYLAGLEIRCPACARMFHIGVIWPDGTSGLGPCAECKGTRKVAMWPMLRGFRCNHMIGFFAPYDGYKLKDCPECQGRGFEINYTPDMAKILDRLTEMDIDWNAENDEFAIGDDTSSGFGSGHDSLTNLILAVYEYCVMKEIRQ